MQNIFYAKTAKIFKEKLKKKGYNQGRSRSQKRYLLLTSIEVVENKQLGRVFLTEVVSPVSERIFVHLERVLNFQRTDVRWQYLNSVKPTGSTPSCKMSFFPSASMTLAALAMALNTVSFSTTETNLPFRMAPQGPAGHH